MKKTLERMREASANDQADAGIITSLFLLPVVFFLLISVIDVGLYFMNEATITKEARDGATTAATLGGVGSMDFYAVAERNYPQRMSQSQLTAAAAEWGFPVRNTIEYLVADSLINSGSTYEVELQNVTCFVHNPNLAYERESVRISKIGYNTVCEVDWAYHGLPFSGWGMIQSRDDAGNIEPTLTTGLSTSDLLSQSGAVANQQYPRPQ